MDRFSVLVIEGIVTAGPAQAPVGGVVVSVRSAGSRRSGGHGITDALGCFGITLAIGRAITLRAAERVQFRVSRTAEDAPFFTSAPMRLAQLSDRLRLEIPEASLAKGFPKPRVRPYVDDAP